VARTSQWRRRVLLFAALLSLAAAPLVVPALVTSATAATKTVYIPSRWVSTGEVPWASNRTKESTNFILLWGEKSGTNPLTAPSPYNFNPDNILSQLETLYSYYVNTMQFTPETGLLAQYKIIVIITNTWNRTELNAWATGGSVDNTVGVINIAPAAAQPGFVGARARAGPRVPELHVPRPVRGGLHRRVRRNFLGDQRRVHGHAGLSEWRRW
jgi:hypothetical protein